MFRNCCEHATIVAPGQRSFSMLALNVYGCAPLHHVDVRPRSRDARRPRFGSNLPLLRTEGAGKAGCPGHPRPVCIGSKHTVVTTGTPEITRLSPRNGFNGFLRALLGDEFLLVTVASGSTTCPRPVGPTHLRRLEHQQRMPGPHDFAVRSDLAKRFDRPCAACRSFGEGIEAPFVRAPVIRSQVRPALRLPIARPTLPRPPHPTARS